MRNEATQSRAGDRRLLAAACALPFVVLGLVFILGVNIPFADEWDWTPFVYHDQLGTLTFAELWRQHNEHRMFFASVIVLALAKLGGWNLIREEVVSVILCAGSQFVLWRLIRRTLPAAAVPIAFFAMSLELWNIGQAENFAMGLQAGWFLLELCILIVVWRLTAANRSAGDFAIAGVAATVASYSSEIGLLAWPVGLCALLLARGTRTLPSVIWAGWGAAAYALFCFGIVNVRFGHTPIAGHIGGLILYSLGYLGVPIAYWSGVAGCVLAGTGLVVLFTAFIVADVRGDAAAHARLTDRAPWYALGLFAILAAIGTGPNRLGIGLEAVKTSTRYILVGSWLTSAVIALILMRFPIRRDRSSLRLTRAGAFLLAIVLATSVSWARGLRDWQHFSTARQADLRAVRAGNLDRVAPYYVLRPVLKSDIAELRLLHDGPLGPNDSAK